MLDDIASPTSQECPACGLQFAKGLLACPQCHRLTFAEELKAAAAAADEATRAGDLSRALASWREALELLPPKSRQYAVIQARVIDLARTVDEQPGAGPPRPAPRTGDPAAPSGWGSGGAGASAAGVGTFALLVWKFKFLAILLLTKGKLLLLGLTKASTFTSMLISASVYWTAFGWRFAVGLVASIYIHEMGHVSALRRFGVKSSAPMFIPLLGAFIRVSQKLPDARTDARVGLAGPIWGTAGALATYALALALDSSALAAIARLAAWINLFNLIPVWHLDGDRGFRSMTRPERWFCAVVIAIMWSVTSEALLVFLLALAALQAAFRPAASEPDRTATAQYACLVVVLSALTMIPVTMPI